MATVRDVFFTTLYNSIHSGEDIYILSSDLGAPSLDDLRKNYPEHFINVGIAEQSLVAIAAGLSEAGKKVVAYGLNPFPITRAYDQVRCLLGEMKIPVTICALNAGLCSASAGYTHMATEVFAMTRMLPNIKIYTPTDETMSKMLVKEVIHREKPRYILFDKISADKIYDEQEINFDKGYHINGVAESYEIGIIGNSSHLKMLRKVSNDFSVKNISITVFDIFALPIDENSFVENLKKCQYLITVEENVLQGGLGSYVLEIMSDHNLNVPIKRLGVNFQNGVPNVFMDRDYLRKLNGLDERGLVNTINEIVDKLRNEKNETHY